MSFTGTGNVHDDQVDALAGAYEGVRVDSMAVAQREAVARHRADMADSFAAENGDPAWRAENPRSGPSQALEFS